MIGMSLIGGVPSFAFVTWARLLLGRPNLLHMHRIIQRGRA